MDDTIQNPEFHREMYEERPALFGLAIQGILCALAIALAIVGLVRSSLLLTSFAVIIIGAVFLLDGGVTVLRFFQALNEKRKSVWQTFEIGEGISAEFLGGTMGIVLGILALLNIVPLTLISIAAIIYGAALVLAAIFSARFDILLLNRDREDQFSRKVGKEAITAAAATEMLIGIAGVVLGILAIRSAYPLTLNLIAIIVLAFGSLLTGTAVSHRLLNVFSNR